MGEIGNVKDKPGAIKKDSKKEDLLIHVEEEREEKADTGDEDVQDECKDYLSTLAQGLMKDRFYLDDIKEKTENDIENRKDYENGRFNHELQNELIKIEIILRGRIPLRHDKKPWQRIGVEYGLAEDGENASSHSFGGCRTSKM
ncbi:hypothetical protein HZH68_016233 [Vespula germanica]|uniref:Uncharacterized protein n=1 Tax=Vespula germanica TaxID=30212 RepID=A0A834J1B4_VESGE|nr:hypothetical protein HZH68_016233 [Vespula germanica]